MKMLIASIRSIALASADQGRADALRRAGDDCDFSLNAHDKIPSFRRPHGIWHAVEPDLHLVEDVFVLPALKPL